MRRLSILFALIGSLFALPAEAANFSAKDAAAATIIFTNPGNCTTGCTPIFAWSDSTGANLVAVLTAGADGASNTATGGLTYGRNLVFNGTTWDRWTGAVTNAGTFAVQLSGATNNINNIAGTISLPTGAATSALQSTGNTSLASILTATPTLTTWAGGTLGAMANYGTSPGAVLVPGVNAFVTNTNANGQATAANSSPVVLPAAQVTADPCTLGTKTNFTFGASTGTIQIVAPSGSTQVYVCSMSLIAAATAVVSMVGGTGASCTTGTPVAALGSTTAASGMSLAANGGYTFGNGGGTAFRTTTAGHGMCIVQNGTTAIAGGGTFVQQ